jgi:hypothetical protein
MLRPVTEVDNVSRRSGVGTFEQKAKDVLAQANAYRELASSLAHDGTNA